jgi:hypothetical protein
MHTATDKTLPARTIPTTLINEAGPVDMPPGLSQVPSRQSDPETKRPATCGPARPKSADEWVQQLEMRVVQPDRLTLVRMRLEIAKYSLINRHDQDSNSPFRESLVGRMTEVESTLRTMVELGLMTHDAMRLELMQLSADMKRPRPA